MQTEVFTRLLINLKQILLDVGCLKNVKAKCKCFICGAYSEFYVAVSWRCVGAVLFLLR